MLLKLNDAVLFLGAVTEDELNRLYEGAAVYVYPAPEEDFGMGVIESMAKGVPVVAWNQAGPTVTVAPGTGCLAEPLEVADYAAGIVVGMLGTGTVTPAQLQEALARG